MTSQSVISRCEPHVSQHTSENAKSSWLRKGIFGLAVVPGLMVLLPILKSAWHLWVGDPLRSIGGLVPIMSVALIVREWRRLGWESRPTWWGLVPLFLSAVALAVRPLAVTLQSDKWNAASLRGGISVDLLPDGLVIVLYAAAYLLMLGGMRVFRKALFPLVLLLLVNPVPSVFSSLDIPLQHISANTARHFAALIGEHPNGTQLRLMFTPEFGMFIAPGCDGIRGAVTLAYLGLFASCWKELSVPIRLLSTATGLALGYLFNFVRLCLLVIYYKIGESIMSIQPYGATVDYVIGGVLFFLASLCFWRMFFSNSARVGANMRDRAFSECGSADGRLAIAAFFCVSVAVGLGNLRACASEVRAARLSATTNQSEVQLPGAIGKYRLVSTWEENLTGGFKAYRWGRYTDGRPDDDVLLGLWVANTHHSAVDCHLARAEEIEAGNDIIHHSPNGATTVYSTFSYDDGLARVFVASALCEKCYGAPKRRLFYGPITVSLGKRTDHLEDPFVGAIVIKHEGSTPGAKDSQQVSDFIANLDERQFMDGQGQ